MRDYVIPAVEIIEYLLEDVIASSGYTKISFIGESYQTDNEFPPSTGEGEGKIGDLAGGGSDDGGDDGDFFT